VHIVEKAGGFGGDATDLKVLERKVRRCVQEDDLQQVNWSIRLSQGCRSGSAFIEMLDLGPGVNNYT